MTTDASPGPGRPNPDLLATPLDLVQYGNIQGVESASNGGATFQSTEAGIPDDAPDTIESTDAQALLGRPPVLHGEDEGTYAELLTRVRADVRPKDILRGVLD